ncbi:hypothetical protein B0H17DRAFT_1190481 [Mycena rosella]|uniref:Uncharacterized protein n=1 Tax=Mycena rosella TaxID=1033263 RepID=A0AAD7H364_MYCRO|nr:hypothetical protein B0H17DRAFT_1190481 [Mycena rosella]
MNRSTRTGRVFSPYGVSAVLLANIPTADIIQMGVDMGPFLQSAMDAANRRAAREAADNPSDPDADEWEDVLDSCPASPLSDLTITPAPTHSPSPTSGSPHNLPSWV